MGTEDIFEAVQTYFEQKGWPVEQNGDQPVLRFQYEGLNGEWYCYARVREETDQFIFLSALEEKVPEDKRVEMAEFLTRANFGLNIGNFEMDFEDGEIRYKTSVDASFVPVTNGLLEPLVKASFTSMDDYLPGIKAVLGGQASPAKALELVLAKLAARQEQEQEEDEEYVTIN